jgi:hypothetical protein
MKRHTRPGGIFKTIRRLITKPGRVHVIYDKEGTAINPRSPSYLYTGIESILLENRETFSSMLHELRPFLTCPEIESVSWAEDDPNEPYWNNGYFSFIDARVAYALTASRRPSRIVEIGSGNSTKFFRKALVDFDVPCQITSIDPRPRAEISGVADIVLRESLLDVDRDLFHSLGDRDILFFDGSHYVFNGTDATRFFLELLPAIRAGVLVHVHDICLPYEYNELFTQRMYNEQYLLACTLMNTSAWQPILPIYYLHMNGYLEELPASEMANTSFWMTRL